MARTFALCFAEIVLSSQPSRTYKIHDTESTHLQVVSTNGSVMSPKPSLEILSAMDGKLCYCSVQGFSQYKNSHRLALIYCPILFRQEIEIQGAVAPPPGCHPSETRDGSSNFLQDLYTNDSLHWSSHLRCSLLGLPKVNKSQFHRSRSFAS